MKTSRLWSGIVVSLTLFATHVQAQDSAEVTQLKAQLNTAFTASDWDAFVQTFERSYSRQFLTRYSVL